VAHQVLDVGQHGGDALAMVVGVQAARRVPVCATPPRASGLNPLGTTSAALGKRAWNLNAIGSSTARVAPQP